MDTQYPPTQRENDDMDKPMSKVADIMKGHWIPDTGAGIKRCL